MTVTASRLSAHNMRGEDHLPGWCAVCGRPYPERHHVVARSLGGASGPMVHLCGRGNALFDADGLLLHHGAAEMHRLHLWWCDGTDADIAPDVRGGWQSAFWAYLLTAEQTDPWDALRMSGWRPFP